MEVTFDDVKAKLKHSDDALAIACAEISELRVAVHRALEQLGSKSTYYPARIVKAHSILRAVIARCPIQGAVTDEDLRRE